MVTSAAPFRPAPDFSNAPLVALVGRPNVGKSALFNRMTGTRSALVEPLAGTTRDRHYGTAQWDRRILRVVDTGGVEGPDADPFSTLIREQVLAALAEANAIVFVVDGVDGLTEADRRIADLLRRATVPVLLAVNKADRREAATTALEFFELGLGEPMLISAYHGRGVAELLDELLAVLPEHVPLPDAERRIRIAIVGRPNVGKSSLTNAILGRGRVIVSDVPGTTRDAIDSPFEFEDQPMLLVDTAGIRRRGHVERGVERHAVAQAEHAIDRADVVFLVIDQGEALAAQDTHIAGYVAEQGKGMVLVVNKWDLAEDRADRQAFARRVDHRYRFAPWAPVLFTSAVTGEGVRDLLEMAVHIDAVRRRRVPTAELNRVVQRAIAEHQPPSAQGRRMKFLYATQAEVEPPTFVFFVNDATLLHFSYRRYLENKLRDTFDFAGTSIRMVFRHRSEERAEPDEDRAPATAEELRA